MLSDTAIISGVCKKHVNVAAAQKGHDMNDFKKCSSIWYILF